MTKILITGANSFIGTNFIEFSQYNDIEEISLHDNRPEDIDYNGYDVILHLAAIVHHSQKISDSLYKQVNKDLCIKVAEQAKKAGVRQFIFLSSIKVYGEFNPESTVRNEDSLCIPDDSYGKSKYEAETELKKLESPTFTVSIIRPPLVYGCGVKANMLNLVNLIRSFPVLPFGKIENRRNFIYVENLVKFIDRIIDLQVSGIFIAKDDETLSTTELILLIAKCLNRKVLLFKLPKILVKLGIYLKPSVFERLFGSLEFENKKTKNILSFSPPYSSEEGIRKWLCKSMDLVPGVEESPS
jgi:nucleoside-diphosphate-sugar epimerase